MSVRLATVGFRMRKSIQIIPGVRMNFSKTGIGYSVGVKGYRITKQADGRVRRTASLPGTGLSYVTTRGSGSGSGRGRGAPSRARAAPPPPSRRVTPPLPRPAPASRPAAGLRKPGWFAPKVERQLYRAFAAHDIDAMQRIRATDPRYALAAASLIAVLYLANHADHNAREPLEAAFATQRDPSNDPFIARYVSARFELTIAEGVTAELTLDRDGIGLELAELHQLDGDIDGAIAIVEQLEPTTCTAVSLTELYLDAHRWDDVTDTTNEVANVDDATALLNVFRGVAFREQGFFDAARESFHEALKTKKREPVIRHRALLERARTYEAEGKRALARKDLETIMAEDSSYDGLDQALAELG
jgi:tetratricopeptide (TPR) repeat protein